LQTKHAKDNDNDIFFKEKTANGTNDVT